MEKAINKYWWVLLVCIFVLALFLRFYKLDSIPKGLYQDETSIGYNAYSILTTGRDEYGKSFPVYFKSFGDQKLPAYIYLTALSEGIFGVNSFAVRFPSAFFGSLSILVLFFLVKKITNENVLALVATFLLAISPWSLHFSRAGFEVNLALFFALSGVLLLVLGRDRSKPQLLLLVGSVVMFALSLYSYNVTRLLSPLLAFSVIFLYRKDYAKIPKIWFLVLGVVLGIVLLPSALTFLSDAGASSASGALISSADIQAKTLEFRSYFIYHPLLAKLFLNKWVGFAWVYLENLGGILNGNFFFLQGSSHGNQGIGTMGVMYLFQLPLFMFGIASMFMGRFQKAKLFILWGIISYLVLALSKEVPHATRGYFLIIPLTIICAFGFIFLMSQIRKFKVLPRRVCYLVLILLAGYNIFYYFASYYVRFPVAYAKSWREEDQALVKYLLANQNKYDKILIDTKAGFIYSSYLFYSKYSPQDFYSNVKRNPDDSEGFSEVTNFGKLEFKDVDWTKDNKQSRVLIVTTENAKPKEISSIKSFNLPIRPVVVSLKEKTYEFPVTDNAYELVEGRE